MPKLFRGFEQVLLLELGFTKEHNNFICIFCWILFINERFLMEKTINFF